MMAKAVVGFIVVGDVSSSSPSKLDRKDGRMNEETVTSGQVWSNIKMMMSMVKTVGLYTR